MGLINRYIVDMSSTSDSGKINALEQFSYYRMERFSRAKPWKKCLITGGIAVAVVGVSVMLAKKLRS